MRQTKYQVRVRYVCFLDLVQYISQCTKLHLSKGGNKTKKQLKNIDKASELIFSIELKKDEEKKC